MVRNQATTCMTMSCSLFVYNIRYIWVIYVGRIYHARFHLGFMSWWKVELLGMGVGGWPRKMFGGLGSWGLPCIPSVDEPSSC